MKQNKHIYYTQKSKNCSKIPLQTVHKLFINSSTSPSFIESFISFVILENKLKTSRIENKPRKIAPSKINKPRPNIKEIRYIYKQYIKILELFLRHSKNITEFSKNKSLKTQILRKKSCFDQIL